MVHVQIVTAGLATPHVQQLDCLRRRRRHLHALAGLPVDAGRRANAPARSAPEAP